MLCLAVRVTISLEPCYLVNLELDIQLRNVERPVSFLCNCQLEGVTSCAAAEPRLPGHTQRINKFYTHLSNIPRLKILLKCNERSNMRLVLDDVIQDVMESRCMDNGAMCRRPKPNSKVTIDLGLAPSCSSHCKGTDVASGQVSASCCRDAGSGREGTSGSGSGRDSGRDSCREDKGSGREDVASGREDAQSGRAYQDSDREAERERERERKREQ